MPHVSFYSFFFFKFLFIFLSSLCLSPSSVLSLFLIPLSLSHSSLSDLLCLCSLCNSLSLILYLIRALSLTPFNNWITLLPLRLTLWSFLETKGSCYRTRQIVISNCNLKTYQTKILVLRLIKIFHTIILVYIKKSLQNFFNTHVNVCTHLYTALKNTYMSTKLFLYTCV